VRKQLEIIGRKENLITLRQAADCKKLLTIKEMKYERDKQKQRM